MSRRTIFGQCVPFALLFNYCWLINAEPLELTDTSSSRSLETTTNKNKSKTLPRLRSWCAITGTCETGLVHRQFAITCCAEGYPEPVESVADLVQNFSSDMVGAASSFNDSCFRYQGNYSYMSNVSGSFSMGIRCKCPDIAMDRNCRNLQPCLNGGYRAFKVALRCVCPGKYFGERCEYYCERGQRVKDPLTGVDTCLCDANYNGHACDRIICRNGGTPATDNRGCYCQPPYLGKHCANRLTETYTHSPDSNLAGSLRKDFTGTVISLLLVVTLLCAMYCMLRRRLNHSTQRSQAFFAELYAARREMIARELVTSASVQAKQLRIGSPVTEAIVSAVSPNVTAYQPSSDPPPSYSFITGTGTEQQQHCTGTRRNGQQPYSTSSTPMTIQTPLEGGGETGLEQQHPNVYELPPLPTYEDAIKLGPPTTNSSNVTTPNTAETRTLTLTDADRVAETRRAAPAQNGTTNEGTTRDRANSGSSDEAVRTYTGTDRTTVVVEDQDETRTSTNDAHCETGQS